MEEFREAAEVNVAKAVFAVDDYFVEVVAFEFCVDELVGGFGVVVRADFCSAAGAAEGAVSAGLGEVEFVGFDLGRSLFHVLFLVFIQKPVTILRGFSELYSNFTQIKPNKQPDPY